MHLLFSIVYCHCSVDNTHSISLAVGMGLPSTNTSITVLVISPTLISLLEVKTAGLAEKGMNECYVIHRHVFIYVHIYCSLETRHTICNVDTSTCIIRLTCILSV